MHTTPWKQQSCFEPLTASCKSLWLLKFDASKLDLTAWETLGWYARLSPGTLHCAEADWSTNYILNTGQKHLIMLPAHKPAAKAKLACTILLSRAMWGRWQRLHRVLREHLLGFQLKRDQRTPASRSNISWPSGSLGAETACLEHWERQIYGKVEGKWKLLRSNTKRPWEEFPRRSEAPYTEAEHSSSWRCMQGAFWKSCNHT